MLFNRLWTLHHAPGRDSPRRSSPRKHDGPKRSAGGAKPPASRNHEGAGQPTSRSHGGAQRPKRGAQRPKPKRGAQGTHPTHVCATGRLNHAGAATSLPPPSCFPPHPARRHQRDFGFAHGLRRRRPGGESSPRAIPGHLGGKIPVPRPSFHQTRIPRQKTRHHPVLPPAQAHRGFLSVGGFRFNYGHYRKSGRKTLAQLIIGRALQRESDRKARGSRFRRGGPACPPARLFLFVIPVLAGDNQEVGRNQSLIGRTRRFSPSRASRIP